jgi:hypothetical protein
VDGWTGQEGKGGRSGNVKIYVKLFSSVVVRRPSFTIILSSYHH